MRRLLLAALAFTAALPALAQGVIRGAGATVPADVYAIWGEGYGRARQVTLQYQGVGSGEGQRRIVAREVDFGASDEPLGEAELQKHKLVQFPTVVGAIVPVVHLKGVKANELRLTGAVLAKIYAGRIRTWHDPEIAALNRGHALPNLPIRRIVREDNSGSTRAFVNYLARHEGWDRAVAPALKVQWPAAAGGGGEAVIAARGTKGVADALKATEGGIAYVAYHEVVRQQLPAVQLQNRAGSFVAADHRSMQAAVNASEMGRSGDETASLIDLPGPEVWPITDTTYVLVPRVATDVAQAKRVLNFFYWVFAQGDKAAAETGFVPLPTRVQARLLSRFKEVVGPDGRGVEFLGGGGAMGSVIAGALPKAGS